jgi:hypothetical protein
MLHNSVLSFASEWYVPFSFGYALATCRLSVAWCVLELGGCFPDQCSYFLCGTTVNFDAPIVESPQFCERDEVDPVNRVFNLTSSSLPYVFDAT